MAKSVHRMSVEEAIRELKIPFAGEYHRQREAKDVVIEALEQRLEQESILDKIRDEIESNAFKDVCGEKFIFVNRINQIIDKCKAEYTDSLEEEKEEDYEEEEIEH